MKAMTLSKEGIPKDIDVELHSMNEGDFMVTPDGWNVRKTLYFSIEAVNAELIRRNKDLQSRTFGNFVFPGKDD